MDFFSDPFLLFLAASLCLYWVASNSQWQNLVLLVASYVFYGWLHPWFALVLAALTLFTYWLGLLIRRRAEKASVFIWLGVVLNLGAFAFFKYFGFFVQPVSVWLQGLGIPAYGLLGIVLPIGLSFYSLQAIGYLVDISRPRGVAQHNLLEFAVFLAFFPKMVAGPLERSTTLLPQLAVTRTWVSSNWEQAALWLTQGYLLKLVVANNVAGVVNKVFLIEHPPLVLLLCGLLGFSVQIFADFAGYTFLARGFARLFGITLLENFNNPYAAVSPSEFWERWHISLSNWLRDYIFFPLQRWVRKALPGRTPVQFWLPPLLTLLASGLWHGTGWNFVAWGLYHGLLLAGYQKLFKGSPQGSSQGGRRLLAQALMFGFTLLGWFLFRSPSLTYVIGVLAHLSLGADYFSLLFALKILSTIAAFSALLFVYPWLQRFQTRPVWLDGLYLALAVSLILVYSTAKVSFIYAGF